MAHERPPLGLTSTVIDPPRVRVRSRPGAGLIGFFLGSTPRRATLSVIVLAAVFCSGCSSSTPLPKLSALPSNASALASLSHTPPTHRVFVEANPQGHLMFIQKAVTALAGKISITIENTSSEFHDVTVIDPTRTKPPASWAGKGILPGLAQDIFPTSSTIGPYGTMRSNTHATIQVRLKPGMYRVICGVYGHAQAGMDIPFRVVAGSGAGDPPPLPATATQLANSVPHNRVVVTADPSGASRWVQNSVHAHSGIVQMELINRSGIPQHLVVFDGNQPTDYLIPDSGIIAHGREAFRIRLAPGNYTIGSLIRPVPTIPLHVS